MYKHGLALVTGTLLAVVLVAAGVYSFGTTNAGPAPPQMLRPDSPQIVLAGARIYTQHCAACHGVRGEGQPNWRERDADGRLPAPPHDASGHTWHHPDAQLFAIVKHGLAKLIDQPDYPTNMPSYDGVLSDNEIVAVLSWIKAQWPQEIQARHSQLNEQHQQSSGR